MDKRYSTKKTLLGIVFGLVLAIILLNIDKNLWWPLELETINGRNTSGWLKATKSNIEDIVLILFDDKTQFLLRQNGIPIKDFEKKGRDLLKIAIEKLEACKVKTIGVNLNLNNPSNPSSDLELIKALSKYKNIVIADSIHSSVYYPKSSILGNAKLGYGELYSDYDKVVHKIELIHKGEKIIPSFSYALFEIISKIKISEELNRKNEFYLRYPKDSFVKYSFIDLIKGNLNPSLLKDKVVILGIGLKSKLIRDQLFNPFEKISYLPDSEIQAIALNNLLEKSYLFRHSLNDYPLLFVFLSMLLGAFFSNVSVIRGLLSGTTLFVIEIIFCQIAFSFSEKLIEMIPFLFMLLGNMVVGSVISLQLNLQEQNLELEDALSMLRKRSKELENSQKKLQGRNIQLNGTLSELNKRMQELKEVRRLLSTKSEDERKRIARDLHDDTLARITDLKIHTESVLNSNNLPLNEKKKLGISIQILDTVTSEIRRIINALRPSMLDNALGLIPAIENLLDGLSKRSNYKIQTKLTTSIARLKMSESDEINLYRIIQEALNNVYKHSEATKVEVSIKDQPGQVLILVDDNGIGFRENKTSKGFGLIDMRERGDLIGGTVQYLGMPRGLGSTLEITIPKDRFIKIEKKELQAIDKITF